MKNIIFSMLILLVCNPVMAFDNGIVNTDYFDNGIVKIPNNTNPPKIYLSEPSSYNPQFKTYSNEPIKYDKKVYNTNSGFSIDDTYYSWNNETQTYRSYTRSGNDIYGSDGSHYTQFGNTVQNNSTGQTYQINGNLVSPLY